MIEEHPFRERLRVVHVTALYRAQRQGDALAACRRTRRFLAEELGVEPGPAFRDLEQAVLRQEPRLNAPHRETSPPLPRIDTLPVAPSSFVGRAQEMADLVGMLADGHARLTTLIGPGGIGKTRLALAAATAAARSFPDGVCWVALDAVAGADRVLGAIGEALNLRPAPDRDLQTAIWEFLKTKQILLVVDNFEHVADAWPVIAGLLHGAPRIAVLVTSRTPLRITGEQRFEVSQLSVPPVDAAPDVAAQFDSVQLFSARAGLIDRRFRIDEISTGIVADLCRRLDGLPLAIELAAALVDDYPPVALSAALDDVLGLLVEGPRDVADRQRTLRGTIDWSYRLLDPAARAVFSTLAVFAGAPDISAVIAVNDGDAEGVEAMANGGSRVPAAVATLVRQGLLRERVSETVGERASDRDIRYPMLQTIRAFAAERLAAAGWERAARRRHAEHYLNVAQTMNARLHGPEQLDAFTRLHAERPDLDAALDWAAGDAGDIDLAMRLVGNLWEFWRIIGDITIPRQRTEDLLRRDPMRDPAIRAAAVSGAGTLCWLHGDLTNARRYHSEALRLFGSSGDQRGVAWSTVCLAVQDTHAGNFDAAERTALDALALARVAGADHIVAAAHNVLGVLAIYRGNDRGAEQHQLEALAISEQLGDGWFAGQALINLSDITEGRGEWGSAVEYVRRALHISSRIGDRVQALFGIEAMAELRLRLGAPGAAARLLGAAHQYRASMAHPLDAVERAALERIIQDARVSAGPVAFAIAWAEGTALAFESAIDEALATSVVGAEVGRRPTHEAAF